MARRIVVLDGYTLNPGDLSWDGLQTLAPTEVHERTPADLIVARAADAEIVLTNKTPLTASSITQLPQLRYIGVLATGYNCVDVNAAKSQGIPVANIPIYGTASVAQFVFALLLELCHHVQSHSDAARAGQWSKNKDWCFSLTPLVELAGKTLGVVGYGRIGRQVGEIGRAFGMKVIAVDRGNDGVTLEQLLTEADVVSLHCPLLPETQGLINAKTLRLMKPTAFLINTSRGPLVAERDLADALNGGRLAGAAVDVLSVEPPPADNPLLQAKNCLVTPHIAWATKEARSRLMNTAVENVAAYLRGQPQNVVNP